MSPQRCRFHRTREHAFWSPQSPLDHAPGVLGFRNFCTSHFLGLSSLLLCGRSGGVSWVCTPSTHVRTFSVRAEAKADCRGAWGLPWTLLPWSLQILVPGRPALPSPALDPLPGQKAGLEAWDAIADTGQQVEAQEQVTGCPGPMGLLRSGRFQLTFNSLGQCQLHLRHYY